jgi:peptidoglycan hydrolase-like protein with peptidoglycan-binding domain
MPGIINGSAFAPRPINPGGNQQILNENATLRDQKAIADVHRQLPTAQDMQVSATNNIKDMQQFLKNRGYNIGVDGVRGPQTNAAVAAFHNHIAPQQFNSRFRPQHPASGKFVPAKPAGNVGRNVFTPGTSGRQAATGGGKGTSTGQPYSAPGAGQYDPLAMAQSDANAQYDPSIKDLTNQTNAAGAQNLAIRKLCKIITPKCRT